MPKVKLSLQNDLAYSDIPTKKQFQTWIDYVASAESITGELTLRIVDIKEIQQLNKIFRHKDKSTNVLSFPYEPFPGEMASKLLGDVVMCAPVIMTEATEQKKDPLAHWAHLSIHGALHLLGFDHEIACEAEIMEAKEIAFLQQLGYANPYE